MRTGDDRRAELVRQGETLFSAHGYRGVTVAEIASAAGVSTGSFYNYFDDKERFYRAILDQIERQGIRQARRVIARFKSPMNQLKALYRFATLGLRRSPLLRGVLTDTRKFGYPSPKERDRRRRGILSAVGSIIDDILSEGARRRTFRVARFNNARRLLVSIYGALLLEFDGEGVEDLVQDVLLLVERGLRRRLVLGDRADRVDRRRQARTRGR